MPKNSEKPVVVSGPVDIVQGDDDRRQVVGGYLGAVSYKGAWNRAISRLKKVGYIEGFSKIQS